MHGPVSGPGKLDQLVAQVDSPGGMHVCVCRMLHRKSDLESYMDQLVAQVTGGMQVCVLRVADEE